MQIMNVVILDSCSENLSSVSDSCASGVSLDKIFGDISNDVKNEVADQTTWLRNGEL